jgi:hypothetical protein
MGLVPECGQHVQVGSSTLIVSCEAAWADTHAATVPGPAAQHEHRQECPYVTNVQRAVVPVEIGATKKKDLVHDVVQPAVGESDAPLLLSFDLNEVLGLFGVPEDLAGPQLGFATDLGPVGSVDGPDPKIEQKGQGLALLVGQSIGETSRLALLNAEGHLNKVFLRKRELIY